MATNYFPLIANSTANTINELPAGDNLNLAGSNIVNAENITANSTFTSTTAHVIGVATIDGVKDDVEFDELQHSMNTCFESVMK